MSEMVRAVVQEAVTEYASGLVKPPAKRPATPTELEADHICNETVDELTREICSETVQEIVSEYMLTQRCEAIWSELVAEVIVDMDIVQQALDEMTLDSALEFILDEEIHRQIYQIIREIMREDRETAGLEAPLLRGTILRTRLGSKPRSRFLDFVMDHMMDATIVSYLSQHIASGGVEFFVTEGSQRILDGLVLEKLVQEFVALSQYRMEITPDMPAPRSPIQDTPKPVSSPSRPIPNHFEDDEFSDTSEIRSVAPKISTDYVLL
ncbi:hypothetical protein HK102_001040 [Quaeritorhiza haematococci]|nr:hypothetical protein HK102_001040 [Quaeritorhiza haematococci]